MSREFTPRTSIVESIPAPNYPGNNQHPGIPLEIKITFFGMTAELVNAIRRTILSRVPSLAIHRVDIVKNTTTLIPEMIAEQHLGFWPLQCSLSLLDSLSFCRHCNHENIYPLPNKDFPLGQFFQDYQMKTVDEIKKDANETFTMNGKIPCCPKCSIVFTLDVDHTNAIHLNDELYVAGSHLQLAPTNRTMCTASQELMLPIYKKQHLKLIAYAIKGTGGYRVESSNTQTTEHSKWLPVAMCYPDPTNPEAIVMTIRTPEQLESNSPSYRLSPMDAFVYSLRLLRENYDLVRHRRMYKILPIQVDARKTDPLYW